MPNTALVKSTSDHVAGVNGPAADAPSSRVNASGVHIMSLGSILLIILVLMLIGVLPTWPHSASWGYYPSGGLGVILIIVVVLLLLGRI
jgi:hypothetical protein